MRQIPYLDLKPLYKRIQPTVEPKIAEMLSSGQYILGPEVEKCEKHLSEYTGAKHSCLVSNGTIALQMALMALEVGVGDEVIVPSFSFFSTAEVVSTIGAVPVFIDVREDTYNMDVSQLKGAITDKTKAIIAVSLYGQIADLCEVMEVANAHSLPIIEDAAQSFGAIYGKQRSCSIATIGCTSFFPAKPLGAAGDGGAVFTNDDHLAEKISNIRVHGQTARYHHEYIGVNGRLDPIQAVVINEKLKHYDSDIEQRKAIAEKYNHAFHPVESITTPFVAEARDSIFAQYTLRTSHNRDEFTVALKEHGVPTSVHYPKGMHEQPIYKKIWSKSLPITEKLGSEVFSLPLYPFMPEEDVQYVIDAVLKVAAQLNKK